MTSNGQMTKARALLNCTASTLFITECLAQCLQLPRHCHNVQVPGIGAVKHGLSMCSVVSFTIVNHTSLHTGKVSGPRWKVEAAVMPKVTTRVFTFPVPFNKKRHYLSGLCLADPHFGVPDHDDILLGADVFSHVVCQGWQLGLPGSPLALNMGLGWARLRTIKSKRSQQSHINKTTANSL